MLGRPLQSRKGSTSSQSTSSSKPSSTINPLNNQISGNNIIIDPNNNNNDNNNDGFIKTDTNNTTSSSINTNNSSSNNSSTSSLNSSSNSQPLSRSDSTSTTTNSNNDNQNNNNNNHRSKIKCSPCSPSILLNPTYMNPPLTSTKDKKSKKPSMTVLLTQYPSTHFLGNKKHLIPTSPLPISTTTTTTTFNNNSINSNDLLGITGAFNNSPPPSGDTRSRSSSLTGLELHPAPPLIFPTPPSPTSHTSNSVEDLGGAPLQSFPSESSSLSRGRSDSVKGKNRLTFAPLPPGRRMFRSNSLTIGVAARASMLSSQGGGSAQPRARYAG